MKIRRLIDSAMCCKEAWSQTATNRLDQGFFKGSRQKSRNLSMRHLTMLSIFMLGFSSLSNAAPYGCFMKDNKTRVVIQQVGRPLNEDYFNSFVKTHSEMKDLKFEVFSDKHKFAHIVCRLAGCTRATDISFKRLKDNIHVGPVYERIDSVTCSASPENGWTTLSLNSAYSKLRGKLPLVARKNLNQPKPQVETQGSRFKNINEILEADEAGALD